MSDATELLLPEGARLLHIGPQKTGSTAIQNALHSARDELREHGVVYPGRGARPRQAGWALLGRYVPRGRQPVGLAHWQKLVREVDQAGSRRVCISNEDFGKADLDEARRIVADLGGGRAHVVAVARRLDRLLPSQWQERVKSRVTLSYEDWLQIVLGDDSHHPVWTNVWVSHDTAALVNRWVQVVGRDRVTLVVSDDSDRDLLPRTFEQMLGLPPGLLEVDSDRSNRSLSLNETELVRHVHRDFVDNGWSDELFRDLMRLGLVNELQSAPRSPDDQPIPPLPRWAAERVAELSAQRADLVKSLGVRYVGDPDWLRAPPTFDLTSETGPVTVSLELATRAVHGVIEGALDRESRIRAQHQRELKQLRSDLHDAEANASPRKPATPRTSTAPEGRVVRETTARELVQVLRDRVLRRLRVHRLQSRRSAR